jgi:hypothetical protein
MLQSRYNRQKTSMALYQLFALSATFLILANYWFILSDSPFLPRLFDYTAYIFFVFGIYKLVKNKDKKISDIKNAK